MPAPSTSEQYFLKIEWAAVSVGNRALGNGRNKKLMGQSTGISETGCQSQTPPIRVGSSGPEQAE